jgi:hypothetical protein
MNWGATGEFYDERAAAALLSAPAPSPGLAGDAELLRGAAGRLPADERQAEPDIMRRP